MTNSPIRGGQAVHLGQFIDPLGREQHRHGRKAANGLCYQYPSTWHAKRLNLHPKKRSLKEDLVKFAIPVILTLPNEKNARAENLRRRGALLY
jgi:hypothetical protein